MEHGTDDTRNLLMLLHSSFCFIIFLLSLRKVPRGDVISLDTIRVAWEAFFLCFVLSCKALRFGQFMQKDTPITAI